MYAPAEHDEITGLTRYLEQQLNALRAAAFGLTEAQSRETPCRSTLSIAGLIKHATHGMRGAVARLRHSGPVELDFAAYAASFVPADGEPTARLLEDFDEARAAYLDAFAAADPDASAVEPPAPWHGRSQEEPIRLRYYLTHQIEEMARHAGHADIIREQIDGVSVPSLVLTLEGAPANAFFQPYVPAPGTIGAS
jgi:hypothetical protein